MDYFHSDLNESLFKMKYIKLTENTTSLSGVVSHFKCCIYNETKHVCFEWTFGYILQYSLWVIWLIWSICIIHNAQCFRRKKYRFFRLSNNNHWNKGKNQKKHFYWISIGQSKNREKITNYEMVLFTVDGFYACQNFAFFQFQY